MNEPVKHIILDLCSGTGAWSKPYAEAGYDVRNITLPDYDVRLWTGYIGLKVHGILAAPPCTCFASSGARWKRNNDQMINAVSVVDACLRIIQQCKPEWWALENPVGRLVRFLGRPAMYFNPCDYGDPYTKKTCLWGDFNQPVRDVVEPIRVCRQGSWIQRLGSGDNDARSITPAGFARAFFEANP